jgi:hypothetical protein
MNSIFTFLIGLVVGATSAAIITYKMFPKNMEKETLITENEGYKKIAHEHFVNKNS